MIELHQNLVDNVLRKANVSKRLRLKIKIPSLSEPWEMYELAVLPAGSHNQGALIVQFEPNAIYAITYRLQKMVPDQTTGRAKPVLCDFCYTWLPGGYGGIISFDKNSQTTQHYYCCYDLLCSLNARGITDRARMSRAHLHEDMTSEQRVVRLKRKLQTVLDHLPCEPVMLDHDIS